MLVGKILCVTGWLLALGLSGWAAPRIYHRFFINRSVVQPEIWRQTLIEKQRELSRPWQDHRPLVMLAGDSHVEYGDWYNLFAGNWAVRNCGLARAKIADVTQLVSAIHVQPTQTMVLMCGINNLGAGEKPEDCLRDYERLLATVRSRLRPESIMVLSVMPLRESLIDRSTHEVTRNVGRFNAALKICCEQEHVLFLNVNSAVTDARGGLADHLTEDGLHLNSAGYRRLASVIAPQLPQPTSQP